MLNQQVRGKFPTRTALRTLSFKQLAKKVAGSEEDFYSPDHLRKKVKDREFPAPIYLSPKKPVWVEEEIDRHLAELMAKRDQGSAK